MIPLNGVAANVSALNLLNMTTIIEANGPVYNGPGATQPRTPFTLRPLEQHQRECIDRAKKYAMEQSIKAVLQRQNQSHQSQQMNIIKRNQTVALLSRVYVGSIAYDVREEHLRTAFQVFGPLKTVTMSWDAATQKHKGFAFLEFEYPEAAMLAIDQMNTTSFSGRSLKVGRPSNLTNADTLIAELVSDSKLENRVYISGIHLELTEDEISLVFEAFGKIVFCRLVRDPIDASRHRGFGYIEYQNQQSASDAVTSMNQFSLGGQLLRVCKAISPPEGYPPVTSNSGTSSTSTTAGTSSHTAGLPPATAVAAASATAKVMTMETEQLPVNMSSVQGATPQAPLNQVDSWPQTDSSSDNIPTATAPLHYPVSQQNDVSSTSQWNDGPNGIGTHASTWDPTPDEFNDSAAFQPVGASLSTVGYPSGHSTISVLLLRNMVDVNECDAELEQEVKEECSQYGPVERVIIHIEPNNYGPPDQEAIVKVFVVFNLPQSAAQAVSALDGRFFAGRQIGAQVYDAQAFLSNNLSL